MQFNTFKVLDAKRNAYITLSKTFTYRLHVLTTDTKMSMSTHKQVGTSNNLSTILGNKYCLNATIRKAVLAGQ